MQIDKDVPIPPAAQGVAKYPFNRMEVGESTTVQKEDAKRAGAAARNMGHRTGKKFSQRVQRDGSVRIWRTA